MRQRYSAIIMSIVIAISMSFSVIPVFAADADGTPVSTFEDLLAMENNPTGTYYLTADIAAKPNTMLFADDGMPFKGQLIGYYNGSEACHKVTVKNNYYKTSGKAYGGCDFSSKKYMGKSTKVSAVTSTKCKALKSSKWTYSKKYKRLILKKNKEV